METWRVLAGAAMSAAMCLLGVVLATNFRGVTEWHVRRSMSAASVIRRVPPLRRPPDVSPEKRLARFILLERVIGVALAAVGLVFLTALATTF
ncbi:hypothetical protein [Micromonospora sp.]|uniref:hypothetical protein n=1 Tax=Micromonospora sp. TaxID=1876 RepID=UPI003B3B58CA